jgi:transcription elongation GreA/GreB family factor
MYYATGVPGRARFGGAPYYATPYGAQPNIAQTTPEQELGYLKDQAQYFQDSLGNINKRIEELEKETENKQ